MNEREDRVDYVELYEQAPVGYLLLEPDSRICNINTTGASMLGWPPEWLIGKTLSRWVTGEERRALLIHLRAAADNSNALTQDLRLKQRSGRHADVRLYTCGRGGRCRSVILDISETTLAERHARAMQDRLAQLMRLGTMGHLTSTLAHELNQPLATVVLNCDTALRILRAEDDISPDVLKSLGQAGQAAAYASDIVRHLRRLIRGDSGERVSTALGPLIVRALQLMEPAAHDAEAQLKVDLPQPLAEVLVSPVQIEQVLVNLLNNSLQGMVRAVSPERRVIVSAQEAKECVQVTVHDTGPGMDAETAARAFIPFQSTQSGGMGLGLPMSRSIIEAHGGRLWVVPGIEGAAVRFTLPRV